MNDNRRDSYNPPVDTTQSPGEDGNAAANEPGNNAAPSLDTTLDTSRTGGMGGMAGTADLDPNPEPQDI
ncbi:hypothetical protein F8S09_09655 [Deinococcus sp. SDU3-2]|uniref:Uncharacterized protein n=1 Tax=Deinococcus terrestris TaxID=2651870 RepID=A0A7X1NWD8_9DEIO|nr:hypothetical protein [Deinococcus terrestris]MPY66950.1 hypothetical protein [Deinococcus terrestris]